VNWKGIKGTKIWDSNSGLFLISGIFGRRVFFLDSEDRLYIEGDAIPNSGYERISPFSFSKLGVLVPAMSEVPVCSFGRSNLLASCYPLGPLGSRDLPVWRLNMHTYTHYILRVLSIHRWAARVKWYLDALHLYYQALLNMTGNVVIGAKSFIFHISAFTFGCKMKSFTQVRTLLHVQELYQNLEDWARTCPLR
jgi:hypothetical protein